MKAIVLFGYVGAFLNTRNKFSYLSYVPDSIREHGALPDYGELTRWWTRKNAHRNSGDVPRMLFLIQNANLALDEGVEGDFAELGVYKGNSARLLADILRVRAPERTLHLFDTFGGFDSRDLSGVDAEVPILFADVSLAAVQEFVGLEACAWHPGYFPDSAVTVDAEHKFALIHLDADLYEPMKAALEFFYERLSRGAVVIVHDYSSGHWPGTPKAVDEFLADKPERLILMPDKSGTAIFRKA